MPHEYDNNNTGALGEPYLSLSFRRKDQQRTQQRTQQQSSRQNEATQTPEPEYGDGGDAPDLF